MAATIKRIAELAGVSIGTVDRVINNRGKVNPDVEARIRMIIEEVKYTPNLMAKSLVLKKHSPKIGVIFHLKASGFNDEVMKGIAQAQKEIADFGVTVPVRSSHNFSVMDQLNIIDEFVEQDVKAIAITPINGQRIIDRIDALIEKKFPIFCFINDIETKNAHPFIGPNAYETGRIAAGLLNLISCGESQRLAVITPLLKMLGHSQRILGLSDALSARYHHIELADICEITSDEIGIYKAVKNYLEANRDVTLLWYATSISDGGITAIKEFDLLHKIKIITLDLQNFIVKGLEDGYISATISQEPYKQGYLTIKTIFNILLEDVYKPTINEEISCEILIRENYHRKIIL